MLEEKVWWTWKVGPGVLLTASSKWRGRPHPSLIVSSPNLGLVEAPDEPAEVCEDPAPPAVEPAPPDEDLPSIMDEIPPNPDDEDDEAAAATA